jgi:hypothetical protein
MGGYDAYRRRNSQKMKKKKKAGILLQLED